MDANALGTLFIAIGTVALVAALSLPLLVSIRARAEVLQARADES